MNEAELLFTHILKIDRPSLYLNKDFILDKDKLEFISLALKRRLKGEPIQYILGEAEFMGLNFKVNKFVLIPRPETEILVETCISLAKKKGSELFSHSGEEREKIILTPFSSSKILDLCTGSGCIAVSLAKNLPDVSIDASDSSAQALSVARENASLNEVEINFIESDLFANSALFSRDYDIIISNPPYIPAGQIKKLQPEVRFEPGIALNGGGDGLDFYRRITKEASCFLKEGGHLLLEIGFGQLCAVKEIFARFKSFEIVRTVKDYNSIDRVIVARKVNTNG